MTYQRGDRIVLVHTGDPHTRLVPGTAGTVTGYDTGSGSSLWPGMTAAPWPCCRTTATRSAPWAAPGRSQKACLAPAAASPHRKSAP
jgi:hypothetical protein